MHEKLEDCPWCGKDDKWAYDGQYCHRCRAGRLVIMHRILTEEEAEVIDIALEWAGYRYARDHLGQPTEQDAARSLDKLMVACADLQAESDGQWSRPADPPLKKCPTDTPPRSQPSR